MFIELTDLEDDKLMINLDSVAMFQEVDGDCVLVFSEGFTKFKSIESYEEVKAIIKEAQK